jgi:hypothetical protein
MPMRMLSKHARGRPATSIIFLLAVLIAGCTGPAEHPAVDQAGAAVERARSAPRVRALAAADLDRAEVALEYARAAARAGAPADQVEHLAYVVSQRVALAEARAAERVARSEIGKLQRALGQVLAEGRLEQSEPARAPLRDDQRRRAVGAMGPERDRQAWASSAQRDGRAGAPSGEHQQERFPAEQDRRERASVQQDEEGARLKQDQWERASVQEEQESSVALNEDQSERAFVEQDHRESVAVEEGQKTLAVLEEDQSERASQEQDQRKRGSVQEDQQTHVALEEDQSEPAFAEQDQRERASEDEPSRELPGEDQQTGTLAEDDQRDHPAEPDPVAAIIGTIPQDITLSLGNLSFEGAEPTGDTIEQLTALVELLLQQPQPSVLIEADFNSPDAEARTVMERRVEVVRAILLKRGIEPARLVVRAAGNGPAEPAGPSSVGEPP